MGEDSDKQSKTEQPTEKKISDALEKGNTPFSRELTNVFSLFTIILVGYTYLPTMVMEMTGLLKGVIANSSNWPLDNPEDASTLQRLLGTKILMILIPVILPLVVIGLITSLSQNTPRLVFERIKPKLSKISILKGLKKLLGKQGFREFSKAIFKFSAAGLIASVVAISQYDFVVSHLMIETTRIPAGIYQLFLMVLLGLALTVTILGVADFIWVRKDWFEDLKMTVQEVKDETKQSEGDPLIKLKSRSIARDRARRSMISKVKEATLVVANPTHFAVAMRYNPKIDKVPVVLAKGQDLIALKIRETAEKHDVPVTVDPPLARALHKSVQVNMEIPVEFYMPLAAIIRSLSHAEK